MSDRHVRIERNFQEARYLDWQVLRDRYGDNIPAAEHEAHNQRFGQERHNEIIKERYEQALEHPERPKDKEQGLHEKRDQASDKETNVAQHNQPTIHNQPIDIEEYQADRQAVSRNNDLNSSLNPTIELENAAEHRRKQEERLSPSTKSEYVEYEKTQQEADNNLDTQLNPNVNLEKVAEQRRIEEREQRIQKEREILKKQMELQKKHERNK